MNDIPNSEALRAHFGPMSSMVERKVLKRLDQHCRAFIELSPFLVLASADAEGNLDASPRGDPPGFVRIIDDVTLLIPDRPGNNRVDTFGNILSSPHVGMIFLVPGIDETLRVNGTARTLTDQDALAGSEVQGRVPKTGIVVHIDEVFFHCGKAIKRAKLWDPASRVERSTFPSLGRIISEQVAGWSAEDADQRIETSYRERMY